METVVIMLSTYNGSKYLNQQLHSIFMQDTECNIVLLVRDDGSSDNTIQILNSWKKKLDIILVEDDESLGSAKSFWKLISLAPDADYYSFVDQDDIWNINKITTAISALENNSVPQLWCSNCKLIDEKGELVQEKMHIKPPVLTIVSQIVCGSIQGCSMVFNRAAFDIIKSKSISEIPMHDIVLLTYVLAEGKVIYEDCPMFSYRLHNNNVVAKQGKSPMKKLKTTLSNWFGENSRNSISRYAEEFVQNESDLLTSDVNKLLCALKSSKKRVSQRKWIVNHPLVVTNNKRGLRSFRIRVLLGII